MACIEQRREENVDGPFYICDTCSHCGNCTTIAPEHFQMTSEGAIIYNQPDTEDEFDICEFAMNECPADSIGDDWEEYHPLVD